MTVKFILQVDEGRYLTLTTVTVEVTKGGDVDGEVKSDGYEVIYYDYEIILGDTIRRRW